MYVGQAERTTKIHLVGATGKSPMARSEKQKPTLTHVALAVEDIQETREKLERRGIWHWAIKGVTGLNSDMGLSKIPSENVIELHKVGSCTRATRSRSARARCARTVEGRRKSVPGGRAE
jgi:hypothetical protein